MKLSEIILQLQAVLPRHSSLLTDSPTITAASHAAGVATITTAAPHGLVVGNAVAFDGIRTIIPIASIVFDVPNLQATITTGLDHDLTPNWRGNPTVTFQGAGNGLDGTFPLVSAVNRRTFVVQHPSDLSALSTVGLETVGIANVYNTLRGSFSVASVPTTTTFTVALTEPTSDLGDLDVSEGVLRARPRITGAVTEEAAIDAYSRDTQNGPQAWAYVIRGENTVSRDRATNLDSAATEQWGQDFRQWLITPFTVLIAKPTSDEELARVSVDAMEDLRPAIFRAVLGREFSTGLTITTGGQTQFVGDTFTRYDRATYWHAFLFEAINEISFEDTVGIPDNVAFRDINITMTADAGQDLSQATSPMSAMIDLDDEPVVP